MKITAGKIGALAIILFFSSLLPIKYNDYSETRTTHFKFDSVSVDVETKSEGEIGYSIFNVIVDADTDYTFKITVNCEESATIIEGHTNYRGADSMSGSYLCDFKNTGLVTFSIHNSSSWITIASKGVANKISLQSLVFYP